MKRVVSKDKVFARCPKCKGDVLIHGVDHDETSYWSDDSAVCQRGGGLCWIGTVADLLDYWSGYVYRMKAPKTIWDKRFRKKRKK